ARRLEPVHAPSCAAFRTTGRMRHTSGSVSRFKPTRCATAPMHALPARDRPGIACPPGNIASAQAVQRCPTAREHFLMNARMKTQADPHVRLDGLLRARSIALVGATERSAWSNGAFANFG